MACFLDAAKKLVHNVQGVVQEFDGHSWEKLAEDIKHLVVASVDDVKSCVTEKDEPEDVALAVEGFLEGLYHVDFIKNDVACVVEHGEKAFDFFNRTLEDMKAF